MGGFAKGDADTGVQAGECVAEAGREVGDVIEGEDPVVTGERDEVAGGYRHWGERRGTGVEE